MTLGNDISRCKLEEEKERKDDKDLPKNSLINMYNLDMVQGWYLNESSIDSQGVLLMIIKE